MFGSLERTHPSPGAKPTGGSKLNFHTRVHCGCMGWPWAPPALPAPRKCFPSGSSWSGLSLAKVPAPHPGLCSPVGILDSCSFRAFGSSPHFTSRVPEAQRMDIGQSSTPGPESGSEPSTLAIFSVLTNTGCRSIWTQRREGAVSSYSQLWQSPGEMTGS